MELRWVPFSEINARHLRLLAASLHAAPKAVRHDNRGFVQRLAGRELRLYEFEGGLLVVHKTDRGRLAIDATACEKLSVVWQLVPLLHKLAADWECDTIETTVFDRRLADAIVKVGGEVESYNLTLTAGGAMK